MFGDFGIPSVRGLRDWSGLTQVQWDRSKSPTRKLDQKLNQKPETKSESLCKSAADPPPAAEREEQPRQTVDPPLAVQTEKKVETPGPVEDDVFETRIDIHDQGTSGDETDKMLVVAGNKHKQRSKGRRRTKRLDAEH